MPTKKKRGTTAPAETELSQIRRRLDAILSVLVEFKPTESAIRSSYDQSIKLRKAGLRPTEIAALTGRAESNINRDLSLARKNGDLPNSVT